jgi:UDP-glucose 4-epimerase
VRVAVVGAAGFLGRRLTAALERRDVAFSSYTRSIPFLAGDGRPAEGLASAGTVFWLATLINPQSAEQQPARVHEDRAAFETFLRALQRLERPPTVVLLSSGGTVYDPAADPPYAESSPTAPISAYGRAKLALEQVLADAAPGRSVALRVSNAYGPGQPGTGGQGVVSHWLRAAASGQPIRLFGDPETTRDYVYVDDVVDALLAVAATDGALPPVVNVGAGRPTSLAELADTVVEVCGVPGVRVVVEQRRSFDVPRTWLDVSLAERVLGWTPRTSLRDGVAAAWDDALSRYPS